MALISWPTVLPVVSSGLSIERGCKRFSCWLVAQIRDPFYEESLTNRLYLKQRLLNLRMKEANLFKVLLVSSIKCLGFEVVKRDHYVVFISLSYEHFVRKMLYAVDTTSMEDGKHPCMPESY